MKKLYSILTIILFAVTNTIQAQNDSIYLWKQGQLIAQHSIKTADLDSITFYRSTLPFTSGASDFSKYIALGDSMSAGYCDNALFIAGQYNAYPTILSQQFSLVGGGAFSTPLMSDNIGGLLFGGSQIQPPRLYFNGSSVVQVSGSPTTEVTNHLNGPFNNMSVPGTKSFHLLVPGYGNAAGVASGQANPYYARFSSSNNASVINDAVAQSITFFSLWTGNNDVLSYATSGGTGVNQTGNSNPNTYGANDITDPTVFANVYNTLLTNLTANGAKGVVANIPYVSSMPYFKTVPYNAVPLDAAQATQLNSGYAAYNGGLTTAMNAGLISPAEKARRTITFQAGNNAVVMVDSYLTSLVALGLPSYRQATAEDFLVLPSRSFIGTYVAGNPSQVNGVSVPLADNWVLSKEEVFEVKLATDAYNNTIQAQAAARGLAFVDVNSLYNQVNNGGIVANGLTLTSTFLTGGMFSLDGVHLSPRGNALMSNKFLQAINSNYGSNLQGVNVGNYPVLFPGNL
jgi:hydrogenase/urease accessory protein HupE